MRIKEGKHTREKPKPDANRSREFVGAAVMAAEYTKRELDKGNRVYGNCTQSALPNRFWKCSWCYAMIQNPSFNWYGRVECVGYLEI